MKRITSDALALLNRMLGLAGAGGKSGKTDLEDERVIQTLDITNVVRRSRTPGNTSGWFFGTLRNEHAGAGTLTSVIDPYTPTGHFVAPYPAVITRDFDVWVLTASIVSNGAAGALMDGAALFVDPLAVDQGWGVDDMTNDAFGNDPYAIARWTGLDISQTGDPYGIAGDGGAMVKIGLRVRRGQQLRFRSDANAAANFNCVIGLGLFAEGIGQDIAVQ